MSRCVRAAWKAVEMASSVDRFDRYANWKGYREGGRRDLSPFIDTSPSQKNETFDFALVV